MWGALALLALASSCLCMRDDDSSTSGSAEKDSYSADPARDSESCRADDEGCAANSQTPTVAPTREECTDAKVTTDTATLRRCAIHAGTLPPCQLVFL